METQAFPLDPWEAKMNKNWIAQLANDIELKYGKETRNHIFGNIDSMENTPEYLSKWFENFTTGLDELDDKEFLQQVMAARCPCGGDYEKIGKTYKAFYEKSSTLAEFVDAIWQWHLDEYGDSDVMELRGNVLYMTKPLGGCAETEGCGKGCHCWLAKRTNNVISDIFCHCCTIGHTGRPFQAAFGNDIKMELVESIVCGGKKCVMTVYLPEKAIDM